MSLLDMQGMHAADSKGFNNERTELSLLSTGVVAQCNDSGLSAAYCNNGS